MIRVPTSHVLENLLITAVFYRPFFKVFILLLRLFLSPINIFLIPKPPVFLLFVKDAHPLLS